MKIFFVLGCFIVSSYAMSEELKTQVIEAFTSFGDACLAESGASSDDLAELMAYKEPSRHEGQCLSFCFSKKFHVLKENGEFDEEGSVKFIEPLKADDPELYEKIYKIGEVCVKETSKDADPCIYATKLHSCGLKKGKEMGLDGGMFEI